MALGPRDIFMSFSFIMLAAVAAAGLLALGLFALIFGRPIRYISNDRIGILESRSLSGHRSWRPHHSGTGTGKSPAAGGSGSLFSHDPPANLDHF